MCFLYTSTSVSLRTFCKFFYELFGVLLRDFDTYLRSVRPTNLDPENPPSDDACRCLFVQLLGFLFFVLHCRCFLFRFCVFTSPAGLRKISCTSLLLTRFTASVAEVSVGVGLRAGIFFLVVRWNEETD